MAAQTAQPHDRGRRQCPVRFLMSRIVCSLRRLALCLRQACGRDGNALCRRSDRSRARLLAALVATLLLAPLPAWLIGNLAYRHGLDAAAAHAAERHKVTAVTLTSVGTAQTGGRRQELPVAARWSQPPGQARIGRLLVPPGTAAGTQVRIWVDEAGQPTRAPRTSADVAADAWFAAAGTLAALTAFGVLGFSLARGALDRGDEEAWAREWAEVEPGWSGRRPHGIDDR